MKKSQIKQIKEIANRFPKSIEEYNTIEVKYGAEFIKLGILQVDGKDINPNKLYRSKTTNIRELNHYNRIKNYITEGKTIENYIEWFEIHHRNMIEKYPKLKK